MKIVLICMFYLIGIFIMASSKDDDYWKKSVNFKDVKPIRPDVECDNPNKPCQPYMAVDLENATKWENGSATINGLTIPPELQFRHYYRDYGCPCTLKKCIRFCCERGFVNDGDCDPPTNITDFDLPVIPDGVLSSKIKNLHEEFFVLHSFRCLTIPMYGLLASGPNKHDKENFKILENGVLIVETPRWNEDKKKFESKSYDYTPDRYCIGWSEKFEGLKFSVCNTEKEFEQNMEETKKLRDFISTHRHLVH